MGWKEWPYWLRGLNVGLLLFVPLIFLSFFLGLSCFSFGGGGPFYCDLTDNIFEIFIYLPLLLSSLLESTFGIRNDFIDIFIFPLLTIAIIGAITGWAIGKFKNQQDG